MRQRARTGAAWPAIVFLVHSAPRTVLEVVTLTGHDGNAVRRCMRTLEAEGLVAPAQEKRRQLPGASGQPSTVWEWQR